MKHEGAQKVVLCTQPPPNTRNRVISCHIKDINSCIYLGLLLFVYIYIELWLKKYQNIARLSHTSIGIMRPLNLSRCVGCFTPPFTLLPSTSNSCCETPSKTTSPILHPVMPPAKVGVGQSNTFGPLITDWVASNWGGKNCIVTVWRWAAPHIWHDALV